MTNIKEFFAFTFAFVQSEHSLSAVIAFTFTFVLCEQAEIINTVNSAAQ